MSSGQLGYALVEGHGEVQAAGNLLARLSAELQLAFTWAPPIRWKNLHLESGLKKGAEFIRRKPQARCLLVLRDEDEACPRETGPQLARWLADLQLPFPSSAVLLHPEYEVLFLPCIDLIAGRELDGRPGVEPGALWNAESWESRRGVKEWLTRQMPANRSYKPTLDQLPMTRMIDFDRLRESGLACFGTLERALRFLGTPAGPGQSYPS